MARNAAGKSASRSFASHLKDNALVVLASVSVSAGAVTFGSAKFMFDRELAAQAAGHEAELKKTQFEHDERVAALKREHDAMQETFEERLLSIERRLEGSELFDVRNFLISNPEEAKLSSRATYYADGGFYASADEGRWEYRTYNELEFAEHLMGAENPLFLMMQGMMPQESRQFGHVHVWKARPESVVDGLSPYRRLFPFISVERIRHADLLGIADQSIQETIAAIAGGEQMADAIDEFVSTSFTKMYRGDTVGMMLAGMLMMNSVAMNMFPNVSYYLKQLQKVGNVMYIQSITTVQGTEVDDAPVDAFFVTSESILISTQESIYVVNTFVPSKEPVPRHEHFAWVSEWLGDFGVILK